MSDDEKARHDSEYKELLALFIELLKYIHADSKEEALYALSELRAEFAINHVLKGLDLDVDEALMLLQSVDDENLTQHDKNLRDRVVAAVNNLIDFAVCEEYQLYKEASDLIGDEEVDFNSDDYEELEALCEKYNDIYATVEDTDIEYAGIMAAWWIKLSAADYVVYWTQNDAKVRPWHMALQGYAAPRDEFPSWMIPPIEYNCRCFLETLEIAAIQGKVSKNQAGTLEIQGKKSLSIKNALKAEKPKQIGDVYSESLAKCGKIFSASHNYFQVKEADMEMLQGFVKRIKEKWYGEV